MLQTELNRLATEVQRKEIDIKTPHYFVHNEPIERSEARKVVSPDIDDKLMKDMKVGDQRIVYGSTVGIFLRHTAPVDFDTLPAKYRGDIDIVRMDNRTEQDAHKGTYLMESGNTVEGVRYEVVDGPKIVQDMRQISVDIVTQGVNLLDEAQNRGNASVETINDIIGLTLDARNLIQIADRWPVETLLLNNMLSEQMMGFLVEKVLVNGQEELRYSVCDPFNRLNDRYSVNDQDRYHRQLLRFSPGIVSQGMPLSGIYELIMRTVTTCGHIETHVPLALNTVTGVMKLPVLEVAGGLSLESDGIAAMHRFDRNLPSFFTSEFMFGMYTFGVMRDFIQEVQKNPRFTDMSNEEVMKTKMQPDHETFIRKTAQEKFAQCSCLGTEEAIFYMFSYFNVGNLIVPAIDASLSAYHRAFDSRVQNTLAFHLSYGSLKDYEWDRSRAVKNELNFFTNVQSACLQLYGSEMAGSYPNGIESAKPGEMLPVPRQAASPKNMSEVIALMYYCRGIIPSEKELNELCISWIPHGKLEQAFNNIPMDFEMGITTDEIRKSLVDIAQRVNLPHKSFKMEMWLAKESANPLKYYAHSLRRLKLVDDAIANIRHLVANA